MLNFCISAQNFFVQLKLLAQYVSSFGNVGSFEEAVWLLKAKLALKALGASAVRAELQTPFVTLGEVRPEVLSRCPCLANCK